MLTPNKKIEGCIELLRAYELPFNHEEGFAVSSIEIYPRGVLLGVRVKSP